MKKILLDTNSYSFFRGKDSRVRKQIQRADKIFLSGIAIGELYTGFFAGSKLDENESDLKGFFSDSRVKFVGITEKTCRIYGKIMVGLNKKGVPIPTNDVWIAASAIETGSTLITYDTHFLKIPGVEVWRALK